MGSTPRLQGSTSSLSRLMKTESDAVAEGSGGSCGLGGKGEESEPSVAWGGEVTLLTRLELARATLLWSEAGRAGLEYPNGLAFNLAGHLIATDWNNHRVAELRLPLPLQVPRVLLPRHNTCCTPTLAALVAGETPQCSTWRANLSLH